MLASEAEARVEPTLDAGDERRLRRYIDLFNARDFAAVRDLIAEDVQLEIVNLTRMRGKTEVSTYFGNYDRLSDWALSLGLVDGRIAILVRDLTGPDEAVRGFMLVEWLEERVIRIWDFRYASYCLVDSDIRAIDN